MKKILLGLILLITSIFAMSDIPDFAKEELQKETTSLVANRYKLRLYDLDGNLVNMAPILKGKWTLLWFYDDRCPFTIKSINDLKIVINYIKDKFGDDFQIILVEALERYPEEIKKFLETFGLDDLPVYMSPSMAMNEYMNVNSTPTAIIVDPFLNIVDKIEEQTIAPIYIKHIDTIMGKFYKAMGYDKEDWQPLLNESVEDIIEKTKYYMKILNEE